MSKRGAMDQKALASGSNPMRTGYLAATRGSDGRGLTASLLRDILTPCQDYCFALCGDS